MLVAKKKIPKNAKRVFKGIRWSVYHWKQKMFDGSYETFEGIRHLSSAKVIATLGNKILVAKQKQPGTKYYYTLLGGIMNEEENPLEAAKRELLEEAGLVSDDWEHFYTISLDWNPKAEHYSYVFVARNCRKTTTPHLDAGERLHVVEFTLKQFSKFVLDREHARMRTGVPTGIKELRSKLKLWR